MKRLLFISSLSILLFGCKAAEQAEKIQSDYFEMVNSGEYTFVATTALPVSYRSIFLNYGYSLKISGDTIISFLPYFGRAYTPPMSAEDNGYMFTSTDFTYTLSDKKKTKEVEIKIKDQKRNVTFYLDIQKSGNATLRISDTYRQPIQFNGRIE